MYTYKFNDKYKVWYIYLRGWCIGDFSTLEKLLEEYPEAKEEV